VKKSWRIPMVPGPVCTVRATEFSLPVEHDTRQRFVPVLVECHNELLDGLICNFLDVSEFIFFVLPVS